MAKKVLPIPAENSACVVNARGTSFARAFKISLRLYRQNEENYEGGDTVVEMTNAPASDCTHGGKITFRKPRS